MAKRVPTLCALRSQLPMSISREQQSVSTLEILDLTKARDGGNFSCRRQGHSPASTHA